MTVSKEINSGILDIKPEGRIDSETAPALEIMINESLSEAEKIIFDFSGVSYISSAGLRVLLSVQKKMNAKGGMIVKNVSEEINELFEMTGFSEILTIE